ncbi:MAG: phage baseplate assembly protein V [Hyphomicrobium sp.]
MSLPKFIVDLYYRIEELERRMENRSRKGKVVEVDAKKGVARVALGKDPATGQPYLSPPIPWKEQRMGFIKTHFPPSVGEQVRIESDSGDFTDAVIDTALPSNANPRPHNKAGEAMIKIGDKHTILMTADKFEHTVGNKKVKAGKIEFENENSSITTQPSVPMSAYTS